MPLPYETRKPLNLPATSFSGDGLAVLQVQGGRYGGDWVISVTDGQDSFGELEAHAPPGRKAELMRDPGYPDRAIETAFIWLLAQAQERGWRVVYWECLNGQYGPREVAYFCTARVIIANERFAPQPGVKYADEQTLDAVMGYSS